jgi:hypothetical protein
LGKKVEIQLQVNKLVLGKTMWDEKDCGLTTVLAVQCRTHPTEIARVAGLMKQNVPFYIIIGTNQAEMDLGTHNIILGSPVNQPQLPLEENPIRMAAAQAAEAEKEQDEAGREDALAEAIEEAEEVTDPPQHNGHGSTEALEQTADTANFLDLSTLDTRQSNGTAVPAAIFLMGLREDCPDGDLREGLVRLLSKLEVPCQSPEDLLAIIEGYPESAGKQLAIEILSQPAKTDADRMFEAIPSAGDEYRQEKQEKEAEKPPRRRRSAAGKTAVAEDYPGMDNLPPEESDHNQEPLNATAQEE